MAGEFTIDATEKVSDPKALAFHKELAELLNRHLDLGCEPLDMVSIMAQQVGRTAFFSQNPTAVAVAGAAMRVGFMSGIQTYDEFVRSGGMQ